MLVDVEAGADHRALGEIAVDVAAEERGASSSGADQIASVAMSCFGLGRSPVSARTRCPRRHQAAISMTRPVYATTIPHPGWRRRIASPNGTCAGSAPAARPPTARRTEPPKPSARQLVNTGAGCQRMVS
ncbi:hypothetical protein Psuf_063710 [Phytohabitans suffuscus]|uniref:Uncharacterized protein n=1 Tax=Phytohabitans suffuscus TaxID=624315 RepID=A0A6F8YSZ6_9ACTN|nr:hypothetical protein Psuf_063710 [Phytohabitans suffuscus]